MIEQAIDSKHDAHVHLLGCLDADDLLWICERFGWPKAEELRWFEHEFTKVAGPEDFTSLHSQSASSAQIRRWLECRSPIAFPRFQASFNLLIAILRGRGLEGEVLRRVAERHAAAGLVRVDFRVFVPTVLDETILSSFLERLARGWDQVRAQIVGFDARVVAHLSRHPEIMRFQLGVILQWQEKTERSDFVAAIDFCEDEQSYEVTHLVRELSKIRGELARRKVELYVHAGECFDRNGIDVSLAELERIIALRPDRIGHGTALGVSARILPDRGVGSSALRRQSMWKLPHGQPELLGALCMKEFAACSEASHVHAAWFDFVDEYQTQLLRQCRLSDIAIETCPSSNLILGGVHSMHEHPVKAFARAGVRLMIGSDDPGVFGADWYEQVSLVQSALHS